jgi:broad specificity phosphatase PhoE
MTTRFVLVRHATCSRTDDTLLGRALDAPLDVRGRAQARALATLLARERVAVVVSSPRQRAAQTGAAVAVRVDCAMRIAHELDEIDFGRWCGQSFAALARDPEWQHWNARRDVASTPAGDTIAAVRERALGCLQRLADELRGHTLVVVTHAEVVRTLLLHARGLPAQTYVQLEIAPASMHVLWHHGTRFYCANEESVAA